LLIVKAFSIATRDDLLLTSLYEGLADYFLFDTKAQLVGGNGRKFDWSVLAHYDGSTPFLLSGGIGPDDASRLSAFSHPRLAGIDLNSRFEAAPALKNVELLKQFLYDIQQNQ
jgi:phosphoribosylanthranilate isomerase